MNTSDNRRPPVEERFLFSVFLALSGGFQDAYTYIVRDQVFANAQTGNIVLMSSCFMEGQWRRGAAYLFPLLAFAIGVWLAENIQHRHRVRARLDWRQLVLLLEMGIMLLVGFLPRRWNTLANCLISLACAMQLQSFRTVAGNPYASTMCIGNLRSGTAALSAYFRERRREELSKAPYYFGVIAVFALGAGLSGVLSRRIGARTIWCAPLFLLIAVWLLGREKKKAAASG